MKKRISSVDLKKMIDVAAGREKADLVLKNGRIVDVFSGKILSGDIAISCGHIVGIGSYSGLEEEDLLGRYVAPGFIDSHIHIESSMTTPEYFASISVPHGTASVIADPHEIVNVCGFAGLFYMVGAGALTPIRYRFMIPSAVPCSPLESSGAVIDSAVVEDLLKTSNFYGLGEVCNMNGVINNDEDVIEKLIATRSAHANIDGHAPKLRGADLNSYLCSGVSTDHESTSVDEVLEKISRGMYIQLRNGSTCLDLENLIPAISRDNASRFLLCTDDIHIATIREQGHIDYMLRTLVERGVDPILAIKMATLNPCQCYRIARHGAIAPGYHAELVVLEDLKSFKVKEVFIHGKKVAENGVYLPEIELYSTDTVTSTMHVKDFTLDSLKLSLKSNHVKTIDIIPSQIITRKGEATVTTDLKGCFVHDDNQDVVKVAVVERHHDTGNVGLGLLRGYGIKRGAIAISVTHDSHNIIATGTSDEDIYAAIEHVIALNGGVAAVLDGEVIDELALPVAGLMSDKPPEVVDEKIRSLEYTAHERLGVYKSLNPLMSLCFMSLSVVPELKITDGGLVDVNAFCFTPVEADEQ